MTPDLEKQEPVRNPEDDNSERLDRPQGRGTMPGVSASGKTQPTRRTRKTTFGLKKSQAASEPLSGSIAASYDYTIKYNNPAPAFHELEDNARIWHVYNDEAAIFDSDMIEEASDSLDILLVFAGLFSVILATFVAQTSQSLSPDNSTFSAALLKELVDLQRAQAKGISSESVPQAEFARPSTHDKWVNGLWFTSLTLSLSSALIAVLVKQWLHQYRLRPSGSPRDRALIRQFRLNSFDKWHVQTIIGLLPTILHISLFLFLVGLVFFLVPLNNVLAVIIGIMTFLLLATYLFSIILPIITVDCPYRTPISHVIYDSLRSDSLKDLEHKYATEEWGTGAHWALFWLDETALNPSVHSIIAESVSALWDFDYRHNGSDKTLASLGLERLSSESLYRDLRIGKPLRLSVPELEGSDWSDLSSEEAKRVQQALLFFILDRGPKHAGSFEGLIDQEFTVLSSDPCQGILALACGLGVRFLKDGESSSSEAATVVPSKRAFSWLLNNHTKLSMPKLHPAVWERLKENEGWKEQDFSLQDMSADLKALIKQSYGQYTPHLHQPVSLSLFFAERVLFPLVWDTFGGDWSVLKQWIDGPAEAAGGLAQVEGGSLEGKQ